MDIEDVFTQDAIESLDTNVADEIEEQLRDIIRRIYVTNEIPPPNDHDIDVALLCFVAGRTYQSDLMSSEQTVTIDITPNTARDFITFLTERGAP